MFRFSPQLLSEIFLIVLTIQPDTINVQYTGLHVKNLSFVSDFNGTSIFQADFLDKLKYKI